MMSMRRRKCINKWLISILLMTMGVLLTPVRTYAQVSQPAAWKTTPTLSRDIYPEYQFRSTSVYSPIVGKTQYISAESYLPYQSVLTTPQRKQRRGMDDEDPEGEELGQIDTPIGDIPFLIMALMAVVYLILLKKRKKVQKNLVMS